MNDGGHQSQYEKLNAIPGVIFVLLNVSDVGGSDQGVNNGEQCLQEDDEEQGDQFLLIGFYDGFDQSVSFLLGRRDHVPVVDEFLVLGFCL